MCTVGPAVLGLVSEALVALWALLELCYVAFSVWLLAKSRAGLLFASSRKSPLRATCAAILLMTPKALVVPWDYHLAPVGLVDAGLVLDYGEVTWYASLFLCEVLPLAWMLGVLSRVTLASIRQSRRCRVSINSSPLSQPHQRCSLEQDTSTGDMSLADLPQVTSLDSTTTKEADGSTSFLRLPGLRLLRQAERVDFSPGALLQSANLRLNGAQPVADEGFVATAIMSHPRTDI